MLTEKDIKEFYKEVEKMGLKFPVAAISKATGYGKSNVSQYLSGKLPPSESFIEAFYKSFPKSTQIVSHETNGNVPELASTSQLLETINLLVRQNDKLIASYDKIAEANRILAGKVEPVSVNVEQESQLTVQTILPGLQELLIDLGLGKLWENRSLGLTILNKRLYGQQEKKQSRGIRDGSGK